MPGILAFDVNETLLDLRVLDAKFEQAVGDPGLRAQWFALMLQVAFVGTMTGSYVSFTEAQHAALQMLASQLNRPINAQAADGIVSAMSSLPAHRDVPAALRRLHAGPYRLVAVTNSVRSVAVDQLMNAGIAEYFDAVVSADEVRQLKPGPAAYLAVAKSQGVSIGDVRLIAAHHWDIAGARAAGCRTAFVARPGAVPSPLAPPDLIVSDIAELADRLLASS